MSSLFQFVYFTLDKIILYSFHSFTYYITQPFITRKNHKERDMFHIHVLPDQTTLTREHSLQCTHHKSSSNQLDKRTFCTVQPFKHTHTESDECKRVQFLSLLSPLRSYVKRIKNKDFAIAEIRTINLRVSKRILSPGTTVPRL